MDFTVQYGFPPFVVFVAGCSALQLLALGLAAHHHFCLATAPALVQEMIDFLPPSVVL